jgi:hypothetical protein
MERETYGGVVAELTGRARTLMEPLELAQHRAEVEILAHQLAALGAGSVDDLIPVVDADPARAARWVAYLLQGLNEGQIAGQIADCEAKGISPAMVAMAMTLRSSSESIESAGVALAAFGKTVPGLPYSSRTQSRRERKQERRRNRRQSR